jgi:prepilin-type N-terminal cleavage/methylation domain-containing protein
MFMILKAKGFTLVELLVVTAVIGVLSTISVIGFSKIQASSRDSERSAVISEALEKYYDANGEYPDCYSMTQATTAVASSTLVGIDPTALTTPLAAAGTNSLGCTALTAGSGTDSFAYVGDGSPACLNVAAAGSCLQYTLQYQSEASGTIVSLKSRHTTQLATSGGTSITAANGTDFSQVTLTWNSVSNASSYNVQYATDSGFTVNPLTVSFPAGSGSSTNGVVTGLTSNQQYYFRVQAVSASTGAVGAYSAPGVPATTWTLTQPVPTPGTITNSTIAISWPQVTHAADYNVVVSSDPSFGTSYIVYNGSYGGSLSSPSYTATGLSVGTTYYFRVTATNGAYASTYGSTNATTIVPVPTGVNATDISATSISVAWNSVSVATTYRIEYSTSSSFSSSSSTTTTQPTVTVTIGSLLQGQIYYARVYALVGSVSSVASSSDNATTTVNTPGAISVSADRPGAVRASTASGWMPGTTFSSGAGNYYYADGSVNDSSCPSGTVENFNWTSKYSAAPPSGPQTQTNSGTTRQTEYVVQPTSGYSVKFSVSEFCNGTDANSSATATVSATATDP